MYKTFPILESGYEGGWPVEAFLKRFLPYLHWKTRKAIQRVKQDQVGKAVGSSVKDVDTMNPVSSSFYIYDVVLTATLGVGF